MSCACPDLTRGLGSNVQAYATKGVNEMPQKRVTLHLTEVQKQELTEFQRNAPSERIGVRAAMVLDCANGMKGTDVAVKYDERPSTVALWKRRYAEEGINGLRNQPRGKSKDGYGPDFPERLLRTVHSAPPAGEQAWTIPLLAEQLQVPEYGIRRYLKKAGIELEHVDDQQVSPVETVRPSRNRQSRNPRRDRARRANPEGSMSGWWPSWRTRTATLSCRMRPLPAASRPQRILT